MRMDRMKTIPSISAILVGTVCHGGIAFSENRFFFENLKFPEGSSGRTVSIHCEHDVVLTAFSISLKYDPRAIRVAGITNSGTSAGQCDYFDGVHDPLKGEIAYGGILDQSLPFDKFL